MAEQREHDKDEFYEAMPGTMSGGRMHKQANETDRNVTRNYVLPWIVALAVILLGLFLIGALNANNSAGSNPPQNPSSGAPAGQGVPSY